MSIANTVSFQHQYASEQPRGEDTGHLTVYDFIRFAQRWNAMGAVKQAAAIAMARGSIDSVTDLIGPQHATEEDRRNEIDTPIWGEVWEFLFDAEEAGFWVHTMEKGGAP